MFLLDNKYQNLSVTKSSPWPIHTYLNFHSLISTFHSLSSISHKKLNWIPIEKIEEFYVSDIKLYVETQNK